ncbi:MAG: hypothetical protein ACFB9N_14875 [Geitlerinemataceae cyanobacterium]
MGRKAKLKRQRKQLAEAALKQAREAAEPSDTEATEGTDDTEQNVPVTRAFLDRMERQGYSLKADNRAPDIPKDEQPKPQRR